MKDIPGIRGDQEASNRITRINENFRETTKAGGALAARIKTLEDAPPEGVPYLKIFGYPDVKNVGNPGNPEAELDNAWEFFIDLSQMTQMRFGFNVLVTATVNVHLRVDYSPDGSTWNPATSYDLTVTGAGWQDTGWVAILPGAIGQTFLNWMTEYGDGTLGGDAHLGHMQILVR